MVELRDCPGNVCVLKPYVGRGVGVLRSLNLIIMWHEEYSNMDNTYERGKFTLDDAATREQGTQGTVLAPRYLCTTCPGVVRSQHCLCAIAEHTHHRRGIVRR